MLRRCLPRFATTFKPTRPIIDVLASLQTLSESWGKDLTLLHRNHVHSAGCWRDLSAASKKKLVDEGLAPDIVSALDKAVAEGLGISVSKKILILYGSQTGTAEAYAKMLATFAVSHGVFPIVSSLNDAVQMLKDGVAAEALMIVCATYGIGEFPSNANKFFDALSAGELTQTLKSTPYAILGLGNSRNENFNAAAKKLDAKLKEIGSQSIMRTQLSCELQPNGHDAVFRSWKRSMWAALGHSDKITTTGTTYMVTPVCGVTEIEFPRRPGYVRAQVRRNALVTPEGYPLRHHQIKVSVDQYTQKDVLNRLATLTDHIEVMPTNSTDLVERALKVLNVNSRDVVEITPLAGAPHSIFDGLKLSIRTILTDVVDLSAIPKRSMLESMSMMAKDTVDQARLTDLADDLTSNSEYDKLTAGVFTIVDALEMFPSVKLNLSQLLTIAPHMAPRTYSLANDPNQSRHEDFEIFYNTPVREVGNGRRHVGLCSSTLERAAVGHFVNIRFTPSNIPLPKDENPVIYIALGTGIGSVRSQLLRRRLLKKSGQKIGPAVLYYGFRHLGKDNAYADELQAMELEGIVQVRLVASHDQPGKFITPMDTFDRSMADFLGTKGEVVYCGLGGSVPLLVEGALRKSGVDVAGMKSAGRYHEEYFTADLDTENMLKNHTGGTETAATLVGRVGKTDMFCFQCEQTMKGKGCTKVGVCGKTPDVAALQDLTVHATRVLSFYAHELRLLGAPEHAEANRYTLFAMFATLTNVNFDATRFVEILHVVNAHTTKLKEDYEAQCKKNHTAPKAPSSYVLPKHLPKEVDALVEMGRNVGVLTRFGETSTQSAACVTEMLTYGLKGIAAYADHSLMNKIENKDIYAFVHKALAFTLSPDSADLSKALPMCLEAGKINVTTMAQLYNSNKTLGVPEPTTVPVSPSPGKCILVSGHDLIILKGLLAATEPLGINVYTHGEMLPAHSYPSLKKHKNLKGHFGGAWMRQAVEFPHFPGPILMTTNCLTEPHESYRAHLFTAGAVGWKGVPHLGENMSNISFESLILATRASKGFGPEDKAFTYADPVGTPRPSTYTVGYGHETILSVAPTILSEIKKGNITRFFVVGGCDGFEGSRSYYTDLVTRLPKTAVVLTVGCGKYRINHLNLGTIGDTGIPRILDLGQCNDSYSAVQVALALADALKCSVSDLPLSIVLSWFEQKAIAVLLSCLSLGLKPIHVGPSLPAFLTPEVLEVLVKDFGVRPLGDVDEDLKVMLAAKGAS